MATGAFWNIREPLQPVGLFDPDAVLTFPIYIGDWMAGMNAEYQEHEVLTDLPLECVSEGTHVDGLIPVTIRVAAGQTAVLNRRYSFTLRVRTTGLQQDDRTLYLRMTER